MLADAVGVAFQRVLDRLADGKIVDAFLAAARAGDFTRLLELLAPGAVIAGDEAAVVTGTPSEIVGQRDVATFFNGAAAAALAVFVGRRPGAAWFHRGQARDGDAVTLSASRSSSRHQLQVGV